jgi:hypothetical protein
VNTGTISMIGNPNGIDRALDIEVGWFEAALNPAFQQGAAANSVTISNSATGTLDGGIEADLLTRSFAFSNDGIINQDADDDEAEAVQLDVAGGDDDDVDAENASFTNSGTIAGSVELELDATVVTIDNGGGISRHLNPGATLYGAGFSGLSVEQETTLNALMNFTNSGTISTADYAGQGISITLEAGAIQSGVAGAETASATVNFTNSGTIAASGGSFLTPLTYSGGAPDEVSIEFASALAITTDAEGASSVSITNSAGATITSRGPSHIGNPGGAQLIPGQSADAGGMAIAALADTVTITNHGTILGGPSFVLTLDNGTILIPDSGINFDGRVGGAIDTFASNDVITNGVTGVIEGGIALRGGDDYLGNYGSIVGDIYFGGGDDRFVQGVNATFDGTAFGGAGEDRFLLDITGGTLSNAVYAQFVSQLDSFEILGVTGSGNIDVSSGDPLPIETIELDDQGTVTFGPGSVIQTQGETAITGTAANNALVVQGTVNGHVDLGDGNNSFTLGGTVNGNVAFGSGSDTLNLEEGWVITGSATGGTGQDSLGVPISGSYEEPTVIDLSRFSDFEELNLDGGGVGAVATNLTFEEINVDRGRLIGLAGSTISGDVNVATGGTFGSAGTVNGNITVGGTLSPGASPGTMTVNGDLTLSAGSTTLFEMTPTASDAIVIDGALTIESGTTLEITGERPLTPGVAYDLITTTDGITGTFSTVDQADTVLGFLNYTANALQLLGTFQLRLDASPQAVATTDYLNGLLTAGTATTGILAAVPDLLEADGFVSEAALGTLHPEAYASAIQIGVENGLAISSALRSANWTGRDHEAGVFTFVRGFGNWRNFKAHANSGVSKADVRSAGFLGGVGYGSETFSVSAFVGHVDGRQRIGAIGAGNDTSGTFLGASAQLALGRFRLGGSVIHDRSSADTSRILFNGTEANSHYRLRGTTLDVQAGYGFDIGGDWDLGPEIGVTHVSVNRGATSESGAGAFDLDVSKGRIGYTLLTADLALRMNAGAFHPRLAIGLRERLNGDRPEVTANFDDVAAGFTVPGAQRYGRAGTVGVGLNWRLSSALSLTAQGNSEFGSHNTAQSIDAALSLKF